MKKVDVTFVCDCCGVALPKEFVRNNQKGDQYFDRQAYNQVRLGNGCKVTFDIAIEYDYNPDQKEFCRVCRVDGLKKILSKLESELTKGD